MSMPSTENQSIRKLRVAHHNRLVARCIIQVALLIGGNAFSFGAEPLQQAAPESTGTVRGTVVYVADPAHPWRLGRYYIKNAKSGLLAEAVVSISKRGV